jgi:hypothetical protein
MLRRRDVDELLEPDDSLEEVSVTSSSSSERVQKLMSKKPGRSRPMLENDVDNCVVVESGIICVKCGMIFFPPRTEEWVVCPGCQARQHMEPVEEVHVLNPNQDMQKTERLMQSAERQKRRAGISLTATSDTHFDDAKNQLSLQMGTVEYREYVEDLQDHNPMKADDVFHQNLEQHNEQVPAELEEANNVDTAMDEFLERKAQDEVGKRQWHNAALGAVALAASFTERQADDAVVGRIGVENAALHDVTIRPDEYEDALATLVEELSK